MKTVGVIINCPILYCKSNDKNGKCKAKEIDMNADYGSAVCDKGFE